MAEENSVVVQNHLVGDYEVRRLFYDTNVYFKYFVPKHLS